MKMKVFTQDWISVNERDLENEVNKFLATLPKNAVRFVHTATAATRTSETDQMETEVVVTVWYDGEPKKPAAEKQKRK